MTIEVFIMKCNIINFYKEASFQNVVITDELLDYLGESFQKKSNLPNPNMTFQEWIDYNIFLRSTKKRKNRT